MQYTSASRSHRYFELFNELGQPVGSVEFDFWFPNKAEITTGKGMRYEMAPRGFWNTELDIIHDRNTVGTVSYGWGQLDLSMENGRSFRIQRNDIWLRSYKLMNDTGETLAIIEAGYDWKELRFTYSIEMEPARFDAGTAALLPPLLLYCARRLRFGHSGVF